MRWLVLIALWAASAWVGLHLAQQESFHMQEWLMIAVWLLSAVTVGATFLRMGRRGTDPSG